MGLKTAALWLGNVWSLRTTAFDEDVCRSVTFNLNQVLNDSLKEINVVSESADYNEHFTEITITSPTNKAPSKKSLQKIKVELASIYRKSLRTDEADIFVENEKLVFEETEILTAPSVKEPNGASIYWRKDIDFKFGKYRATGFIGILKDINSTKNGFVLLRRGRVVYGAETDGRYFPKSLSGSTGTVQIQTYIWRIGIRRFCCFL